ncbi:MAG: tryptophan--tRNA ligase [Proteobacteria bacterium]|jgi:tryptophanyl-tRNA synthetase|nr:tryptophan--tRNA ligase [Pseudomonadota bacterium]
MTAERVFSGIQPTGEIHLGNYLGAVKKWVELTADHDAIYCIVDDHAITVEYDPARLPELTFGAVRTAMACGLEPSRCTIFVQSHVPEHAELTWLFNTVTPLGSLFRMTQFKDKARNALKRALSKKEGGARRSALFALRQSGEAAAAMAEELGREIAALDPDAAEDDDGGAARVNERMGALLQHLQVGVGVAEASTALLDYPVLQAADILLYKAALVPVGEDQEQHLELAREVAERFNRRFKEVFPLVRRVRGEAPRILGLDGRQKMSKSLGNHIGVLDPPNVVAAKLKPAYTDPQRVRRSDPGRPELCNIFSLHGFFTGSIEREEIAAGCRAAWIGCADCKKALAVGIDRALAPIRERAAALEARPMAVLDALDSGAARARGIAAATMEEVRAAMGIGRAALARFAK